MSGISSGIGLVSGINYQSLISQLVAIDQQPSDLVEAQIAEVGAENTAFTSLSSGLSGIQTIANSLSLPDTFLAATATSSNNNVLTATANEGAAVGNYQFQVAQLVTTQQSVTQGFASATNSPIGAGTLTIEEGGGEAFSQTPLSQLNGGAGVQRGQFRITDGSGNSAVIDTSDAVSLDDVINDINSASNISVKATLSNNGIVLTDTSGQSKNPLTVADLAGGTAAESLGIAGSASGTVLTGSSINYIGADTQLGTLNDGRGITSASGIGITGTTLLSTLDGGAGIGALGGSQNDFKVTTADGSSFNVSLSGTTTVGGVISAINSASKGDVTAAIAPGGQGLQLTDTTTGSGNITVAALGSSPAASRLGILGTGSDGSLTGTAITSPDFQVNLSNGSSFDVTIGSAQTVGQVLAAINTAADGNATASIASNGQGLQITDDTDGTGTFSIAALNGSTAASDLGIQQTASSPTLAGSAVLAGLDSVLVSSLHGGSGVPLGIISLTDRAGDTGTIDLTNANSLSDILGDINNNTLGIKVTASLNSSGTGIQLADNSGGTGSLIVSDTNSTTAASLGIAGTFGLNVSADIGSNLERQWVSNNTLLSSLNGGQGVQLGQFQITNSAGASTTIDLTQGNVNTVGDVINAINNSHAGVTAAINADGNGILLSDNANGKLQLKVSDLTGSSAADLNLAGTAATGSTTIDGAYQKTINVTASDTLSTLQSKINSLGFGITAQIVNDGSSTNPFRLSLTSLNSGSAGQVILDGGTTNLGPQTLVAAQDAAVFLGGGTGGSAQPLLITSSTNQINNVVKGVNITLTGASSQPVTLAVALDSSGISSDLSNFVSQFNSITGEIGTLTQFNTSTNEGGLLLGNPTAQQITQVLFNAINTSVSGAGEFKSLADLGITIGDNAQLSFDSNTFTAAFTTDPNAVQSLFTQTEQVLDTTTGKDDKTDQTGLGYVLSNAITQLTDPVSGIITLQEQTLTQRASNYQTYLNELNAMVAQKQQQLETTFANLEGNIASLQSQGQVISTIAGSTAAINSAADSTPAATSSSSSDSSSSDSSSGSSSSS